MRNRNKHKRDDKNRHNQFDDDIVEVALSEIHVSEKNVQRVLRDQTQIERMRADFERGRNMVRVVLKPRITGGYDVEDGRHRVIAAMLAGLSYIDAVIIGS